LGRVIEDGPQQQLEFTRAVFLEPLRVSLLYAGGPHAIFPAPSIQGAQAAERRRQRTPKISRKQRLEAENGGEISFYHRGLTVFGHPASRGQFF
jgi:hypothetical protein